MLIKLETKRRTYMHVLKSITKTPERKCRHKVGWKEYEAIGSFLKCQKFFLLHVILMPPPNSNYTERISIYEHGRWRFLLYM